MGLRRLNVGCGRNIVEGWVNLDSANFSDENDYLALKALKRFVLDIQPGWTFQVKDDIVRTHAPIISRE